MVSSIYDYAIGIAKKAATTFWSMTQIDPTISVTP
jgi:hypothetical protein